MCKKDIEGILDSMREQQEKHEAKQIEMKKLEQQFLQQKDETEKKKIETLIKKKKKDLVKLEKTVRTYEEISELTLQVTAIMIKAGMQQSFFILLNVSHTRSHCWGLGRGVARSNHPCFQGR